MPDYLIVIPARYSSKRLPGKPLIDINGIPMVIRTFNQCKKTVPASKIIIATDDKRIQKICSKNGINSIITSKKCLTGTDRIAEVAKKIKKRFDKRSKHSRTSWSRCESRWSDRWYSSLVPCLPTSARPKIDRT